MSFILTHNGVRFDLGRPMPGTVRIEDIAHHLALFNRFTGATVRPYSVAEHSLLVAEILERAGASPQCQHAALLHDAHEAYTGDMSTPVKPYAGDRYHAMVRGVVHAIEQRFCISDAARAHALAIKYADRVALATERRDLMPEHADEWPVLVGVEPVDWIDLNDRAGMDWTDWRLAFLCRQAELESAESENR